MGMYVKAFLMPSTLDRVVYWCNTYRTSFWHTYGEAKGVEKIPLPALLREADAASGLPWLDNTHAHVMGVARYLELAQQYRDAFNGEYGDAEGAMYIDGLTEWLRFGRPWTGFVVVLVPEE